MSAGVLRSGAAGDATPGSDGDPITRLFPKCRPKYAGQHHERIIEIAGGRELYSQSRTKAVRKLRHNNTHKHNLRNKIRSISKEAIEYGMDNVSHEISLHRINSEPKKMISRHTSPTYTNGDRDILIDQTMGIPKNSSPILDPHKTNDVSAKSSPIAVVADGEVVVFDGDDDWKGLRTEPDASDNEVDMSVKRTLESLKNGDIDLVNNKSVTSGSDSSPSKDDARLSDGSATGAWLSGDEDKNRVTRVIGELPIAEYEGSPRRYGVGSQKNQLRSPRPGFPQRIITESRDETPPRSSTAFDYLYEFSETRKVLEEFFKCPQQQIGTDEIVNFQELDYELRRQTQECPSENSIDDSESEWPPADSLHSPHTTHNHTNFLGLQWIMDICSNTDHEIDPIASSTVSVSDNIVVWQMILRNGCTKQRTSCETWGSKYQLVQYIPNQQCTRYGAPDMSALRAGHSALADKATDVPLEDEEVIGDGASGDTSPRRELALAMSSPGSDSDSDLSLALMENELSEMKESGRRLHKVQTPLTSKRPVEMKTRRTRTSRQTDCWVSSELMIKGSLMISYMEAKSNYEAIDSSGSDEISIVNTVDDTSHVEKYNDIARCKELSNERVPDIDKQTDVNNAKNRVSVNECNVQLGDCEDEENDIDNLTNELRNEIYINDFDVCVAVSNDDSDGLSSLLVEERNDSDMASVLIEGVLFRARYLGSTQLACEGQPTKATRMLQAEEAVSRIKAPEGENQPSTEVDLFISTEKIMVLNTELKEIMMDHALRTISYIADIGDLVVLMARRRFVPHETDSDQPKLSRTPKMICHVFESEEAQFIAQSIGQAFQVAYMEFLKANGIEDHSFVKEMDYQEVLNSQEIFGDELQMFAKKELQKEVVVPKTKGEILGVVVVESGWGSMLPTVVIANLAPAGAAARCGQLNIDVREELQEPDGGETDGGAVRARGRGQDQEARHQICSLLRGGIAERGGVRVGHRIIEINSQSVVAVPHERIILMKTMPTSMFRLLTGQENPVFI
ncbi:unnamed protein product [Leptidea sinapis]|uniref:PDZ domain-containing protein n=1 Tax=Leptidea sinapis TaxID=189913 RepID=A0A5E4R014_9NEOP|nr:unnamed protein product [Leptidea sinapis]